jgi:hypothetical protein
MIYTSIYTKNDLLVNIYIHHTRKSKSAKQINILNAEIYKTRKSTREEDLQDKKFH